MSALSEQSTSELNEPIALYWEDDDWTCSFKCGVTAGYAYNWFGPNDLTLEDAQLAAEDFWEADDRGTYSVFDPNDEHAPLQGARCRNPYCERLLT